jgi:branched-subunit amino acid aminotransferase/4-amino-4-deoxychorismate lyase
MIKMKYINDSPNAGIVQNIYKEMEHSKHRGINVKFVVQNGELKKKDEANISIFSKAMFFNFAVYDSMKVIKGKPFFAEFHADRLIESAKLIGLEHPFTKEGILKDIDLIIKENGLQDAMIRFLLLGSGGPGESPQLFLFPVGLTFYQSRDYSKGVKAVTFHGERPVPQSKSKDLLLNFMGLREAIHKGAKDALLIDSEGCIREGTRTNFFGVKDGKLYTAPLSDVLEGVTRKIIMRIAKENGIEVVEEKINASKLKDYDEFFFTSTSMNVLPISQIDEYEIPGGVGPVTKTFIKLFKDYYHKEVFEE